jgi:hypothetical protein
MGFRKGAIKCEKSAIEPRKMNNGKAPSKGYKINAKRRIREE